MIRECFREIAEDRFKEIVESVKHIIDNYEDWQIENHLVNGIAISENIIIQKYPGGPFNCFNKDQFMIGLNPVCRVIETRLNNKLTKLVHS
jgi:hypothetical protein